MDVNDFFSISNMYNTDSVNFVHSLPITAALVKNCGFVFITNLINKFFDEFCTANKINTRNFVDVRIVSKKELDDDFDERL